MTGMMTYKERLANEQRAVLLGIYSSIALSILAECESISKTKILFLSFLCKPSLVNLRGIVSPNQKRELLSHAACNVSGKFEQLQRELPYIVDALALLVKSGCVNDMGNTYILTLHGQELSAAFENAFYRRLAAEAATLDDAFVVLEVIRNV